jgi:hypothetical protein
VCLFCLPPAVASTAPGPAGTVTYIGRAVIDGTGIDKSGLPGTILEDGASPRNGLNGFGSAIAYAGGNRYFLLADRGPNKVAYAGGEVVDYTTSYPNRYQVFEITVSARGGGYAMAATNVATVLLRNAQGIQFTGASTGYSTRPGRENRRLDSEGIRVARNGTVYVSDEYGPYIYHFDARGHEIEALPVPPKFLAAIPGPNAVYEAAHNTIGRVTNRGLEGLAITPNGRLLVAALQSPLVQDGGLTGINDRILVFDLNRPAVPPKEYLYRLDNPRQAISEILAVNNHQFLVDERDATGGPAGVKLLYEIDLQQNPLPTNVAAGAYAGTTAGNGLPLSAVPAGVTPLTKRLFANIGVILNDAHPFTTPNGLPDKIEGYAWGPDLPNGDHLLLATNDNDFALPTMSDYRPNYIFAFAVAPSALPEFQAQRFSPERAGPAQHGPGSEDFRALTTAAGFLRGVGWRRH